LFDREKLDLEQKRFHNPPNLPQSVLSNKLKVLGINSMPPSEEASFGVPPINFFGPFKKIWGGQYDRPQAEGVG
jgi:hypothetical protein